MGGRKNATYYNHHKRFKINKINYFVHCKEMTDQVSSSKSLWANLILCDYHIESEIKTFTHMCFRI